MNKPNLPETIVPGKSYSFWVDTKVNCWLGVAALISGISDVVFHFVVKDWPLGWQVAIVLAQFLAILLWVRSFRRWVRGMDELHQRIAQASIFFAVSAAFFLIVLLDRLGKVGLFRAVFPGNKYFNNGPDILTVCHVFLLTAFFYFFGHFIFNRRYK